MTAEQKAASEKAARILEHRKEATPGGFRAGDQCANQREKGELHFPIFWEDCGCAAHVFKKADADYIATACNDGPAVATALIDAHAEIERLRAVCGIYVASKTKHAPMWRTLRKYAVAPIISTWIDEAGAGESSDIPDLAKRCIDEASRAAATVLYCEPGEVLKGALMEVGAALASGRMVYSVGHCDGLSSVFVQHPNWRTMATVQDAMNSAALDALKEIAT